MMNSKGTTEMHLYVASDAYLCLDGVATIETVDNPTCSRD